MLILHAYSKFTEAKYYKSWDHWRVCPVVTFRVSELIEVRAKHLVIKREKNPTVCLTLGLDKIPIFPLKRNSSTSHGPWDSHVRAFLLACQMRCQNSAMPSFMPHETRFGNVTLAYCLLTLSSTSLLMCSSVTR